MSDSLEKKEGSPPPPEDEFVEVSLDDDKLPEEDKKEKIDQVSPNDKYSDKVDLVKDILSGIPVRPKMRLMTFDELQQKIGRKPLPNQFGGLVKMSARYKAVGTELEKLQNRLANTKVHELADKDGREKFGKEIRQQIDEIQKKANDYMDGHSGDLKVIGAIESLFDEIDQFRKDLPKTIEALYQEKLSEYPKGFAPEQIAVASRYDVPLESLRKISGKHCNFTALNDETLTEPVKELGKGACNTVQLVTHGGVQRVFKKEKQDDIGGNGPAEIMGIDRNDPRYGNRNIAGGLIGELLGTGVMPKCSFGISKGVVSKSKSTKLFSKKEEPRNEVGLVMEKAPGEPAFALLKKLESGKVVLSPKALASLQEQLAELEVCDILISQGDRHQNNYLVDVQGDKVTVTGIDNDFSFPNPKTCVFDTDEIPAKFEGMHTLHKLPKLIGKAMAEKIKSLDFDRDIAPGLADLLDKDEVAFTKERLLALQKHVNKLESDGCIVADWEKWRSKDDETASEFLTNETVMRNNMFLRDFALPLNATTLKDKTWGY